MEESAGSQWPSGKSADSYYLRLSVLSLTAMGLSLAWQTSEKGTFCLPWVFFFVFFQKALVFAHLYTTKVLLAEGQVFFPRDAHLYTTKVLLVKGQIFFPKDAHLYTTKILLAECQMFFPRDAHLYITKVLLVEGQMCFSRDAHLYTTKVLLAEGPVFFPEMPTSTQQRFMPAENQGVFSPESSVFLPTQQSA